MQIQYQQLAYQHDVIYSVVDLFKGEPNHQHEFHLTAEHDDVVSANQLDLAWETIADNLHDIQQRNGLNISNTTEQDLNFTVEMETGTGKTYVYLRTILQLNQQYGWQKFIIVVPSVAIREGVMQTLRSTQQHFRDEFNGVVFDFNQYDSSKINVLENFKRNNHIEILVMNIQSFEKDDNVINQQREKGQLIQLIQAVNPILIIDEPQNISTEKRKNAIASLNPLFSVGYSATHKESYHKVYSLNPVQAYEQKLVKQIAVRSVLAENNYNSAYIEVLEVVHKGKHLSAKIKIDVMDKKETKRKPINVKSGDDLYEKSGRNPHYAQGFIINGLDMETQRISLNNGRIVKQGDKIDDMKDDIMKAQIHETIKEHLQREQVLNLKGIKVLSLFFIDKVQHYRSSEQGEKGKFYQWFEELYELETGQKATGVHNGYFSQDKNGFKDTNGATDADKATYELIMKNKERLLSLDEPLRFIFSHSALREGWDNPNVFQICTLNETASTMKKRQEIGRGLRLPVNKFGERIVHDDEVNVLTIIPNESYEVFAQTLQQEYEDDCGLHFPKPKNKKDVKKLRYRYDLITHPLFNEIWQKISYQTQYQVNFDREKLIDTASQALAKMEKIQAPKIRVQRAKLQQSMKEGVQTLALGDNSHDVKVEIAIPDVLKAIQDKTGLTRHTIVRILQQSGQIAQISINPQRFIDVVSEIINEKLRHLMVDGIQYCNTPQQDHYQQQLIELLSKEHEFFENKYTFNISNEDKTIYIEHIPLDSQTEKQFAQDCEVDNQVGGANAIFYFKLPSWFKIPTPLGTYNPDWAVILTPNAQDSQKVYFVAETKNTGQSVQGGVNVEALPIAQQLKIACAKKHFALNQDVHYAVVQQVKDLKIE